MKGISAPARSAIVAIVLSSVDTITRSMGSQLIAASIEYVINGRPFRDLIFFCGIPFDPPRAGIIATVASSSIAVSISDPPLKNLRSVARRNPSIDTAELLPNVAEEVDFEFGVRLPSAIQGLDDRFYPT